MDTGSLLADLFGAKDDKDGREEGESGNSGWSAWPHLTTSQNVVQGHFNVGSPAHWQTKMLGSVEISFLKHQSMNSVLQNRNCLWERPSEIKQMRRNAIYHTFVANPWGWHIEFVRRRKRKPARGRRHNDVKDGYLVSAIYHLYLISKSITLAAAQPILSPLSFN